MLETTSGPWIDRSHIKPVTRREESIYLLSRAAELEHGLACIYLAELKALEAGLGCSIQASLNGPYLVTNADNLENSREHYALCRCGRSKNKPFCSGMHWYVNFHDEKN